MRRSFLVAGAVVLVMLLALPAQAKVAGEATISGPGLGGGAGDGGGNGSVTLSGSDGSGWAAFSGLLDTARIGADQAPTKRLGPRYRVVLDVRQPPQPNDVVQYVYPYAETGPVLYTPPGQKLLDFDAPSGWWGASTGLMGLLEDAGLPAENPVLEAGRARRVAPPASGISPVVWSTAALGALLLGGAVVVRRRVRAARVVTS